MKKLLLGTAIVLILGAVFVGRNGKIGSIIRKLSFRDSPSTTRTTTPKPTKTPTPSGTSVTPPAGANVFRSGFESNLSIKDFIMKFSGSSQWQARIVGTDTTTGDTWPDDLPGDAQNAKFEYLVSSNNNLDDYIETRIEEVTGPQGTRTKALYQEVKKDDASISRVVSRNAFVIAPETGKDFEEGYSKYWIKLQPNLKELYAGAPFAWRNVMEWRETGNQYRIVLSITKENEQYYWRVAGESNFAFRPGMKEESGNWWVDWEIDTFSVPVPVGEWFLLETSFKRHPSNGKMIASVNGQSIANHTGRTMFDGPLAGWHVFKAYTLEAAFAKGPVYQWIDDVYLCTGSGCGF